MLFVELKPGTLLSPAAVVMASCASFDERPNIITLAWVGTVNSDPPMVSVSIRPKRHSYRIVKESGEFVINLVSRKLMTAADFCGVRSGKELDKFKACALDPIAVSGMRHAPAIMQSPAYLACAVRREIDLGSHAMFLGEIVSMGVKKSLMDDMGKVDFSRADLIAYCHGEYMGLKKPEGFFGFSVARPEVLRRRLGKK